MFREEKKMNQPITMTLLQALEYMERTGGSVRLVPVLSPSYYKMFQGNKLLKLTPDTNCTSTWKVVDLDYWKECEHFDCVRYEPCDIK